METPKVPVLGVCMIVKNESKVIARALRSFKEHIDTWVIVDTGSTDDTMEIIKREMEGIPGKLVSRPWVNFGVNRTEMLAECEGVCDWAMLMDADDSYFGTSPIDRGLLALAETSLVDSFFMKIVHGTIEHQRINIFRIASKWVYRRAIHEYSECTAPRGGGSWILSSDKHHIIARTEGSRSEDPRKYEKDAELLEMEEDQTDTRTQFYLAQSYKCASSKQKAIDAYKSRILPGSNGEPRGFSEEVYVSHVELIELSSTAEDIFHHSSEAYKINRNRIEASTTALSKLRRLNVPFSENTYGEVKRTNASVLYENTTSSCRKFPQNALFANSQSYKWRFADEAAIVCFWTAKGSPDPKSRYAEGAVHAIDALVGARASGEGDETISRLIENARFCVRGAAASV